ncbi:MAG: 16S rRNA (guanine(966)-N(2))-methyltransferase RsmD [Chloroflexota bacterium]
MSHRVIGGTARGRRLQLVPGDTTRPVKDLVKESLFNIIGRDVVDATFLDLFAGTGAVGIEALSRGARHALFLEMAGIAIKTINENLKVTELTDRATVRRADALGVLRGSPPAQPFDFIYVAPPQYKGIWLEVLNVLDTNPGWLGEDTQVIVQIDPSEYAPLGLRHISVRDERRYGKTMLLFMERNELPFDPTNGQVNK